MRRPHREADALFAVLLHEVRTEHLLRMIVRTLVKEVEIKLTECRCLHTIPSYIFLQEARRCAVRPYTATR